MVRPLSLRERFTAHLRDDWRFDPQEMARRMKASGFLDVLPLLVAAHAQKSFEERAHSPVELVQKFNRTRIEYITTDPANANLWTMCIPFETKFYFRGGNAYDIEGDTLLDRTINRVTVGMFQTYQEVLNCLTTADQADQANTTQE